MLASWLKSALVVIEIEEFLERVTVTRKDVTNSAQNDVAAFFAPRAAVGAVQGAAMRVGTGAAGARRAAQRGAAARAAESARRARAPGRTRYGGTVQRLVRQRVRGVRARPSRWCSAVARAAESVRRVRAPGRARNGGAARRRARVGMELRDDSPARVRRGARAVQPVLRRREALHHCDDVADVLAVGILDALRTWRRHPRYVTRERRVTRYAVRHRRTPVARRGRRMARDGCAPRAGRRAPDPTGAAGTGGATTRLRQRAKSRGSRPLAPVGLASVRAHHRCSARRVSGSTHAARRNGSAHTARPSPKGAQTRMRARAGVGGGRTYHPFNTFF